MIPYRATFLVAFALLGTEARAVGPEPAAAAAAAPAIPPESPSEAPAPSGASSGASPARADGAPPAGNPDDLGNAQRYATPEDVESLKDVLEEKIQRGVRSRNRINFSGFVTGGFYYQRDQSDAFRVANANFTFSGFLREDPVDDGDLRYLVSVFYAGPSGGASTASGSSVQVSDGVLLWDLLKQKTRLEPSFTSTLTLGQQLVPFGSDNTAREDKLPTINRAQYVGRLGLARDIGLTVDGGLLHRFDPPSGLTLPIIAYTLGAYNGSGANRWDDNKAKDYVAKVIVTPETRFFSLFRGLKLGGSGYLGNVGQAGLPERWRWGAELEWLRKPFLLTAEYVRAFDETLPTATAPAAQAKSEAVVGTLFFQQSALPDFQPLVRFDYLDPNTGKGDDARIVGTAGFNWFFWQVEPITRRTYEVAKTERVVKLQVNYNRIWDRATRNGNQVLAQLVASF